MRLFSQFQPMHFLDFLLRALKIDEATLMDIDSLLVSNHLIFLELI